MAALRSERIEWIGIVGQEVDREAILAVLDAPWPASWFWLRPAAARASANCRPASTKPVALPWSSARLSSFINESIDLV